MLVTWISTFWPQINLRSEEQLSRAEVSDPRCRPDVHTGRECADFAGVRISQGGLRGVAEFRRLFLHDADERCGVIGYINHSYAHEVLAGTGKRESNRTRIGTWNRVAAAAGVSFLRADNDHVRERARITRCALKVRQLACAGVQIAVRDCAPVRVHQVNANGPVGLGGVVNRVKSQRMSAVAGPLESQEYILASLKLISRRIPVKVVE